MFRAALAAYTKIFADTYAADNVRMNNILPGWIDSLPKTEERRESVPMKRYGTSEEIAATIAFLASERRRLHHRAEHPGRWRAHALDLIRAAPEKSPGRSGPGPSFSTTAQSTRSASTTRPQCDAVQTSAPPSLSIQPGIVSSAHFWVTAPR